MQTLRARKKQPRFPFLFLALTPQTPLCRGRGAALSRFCLQALLAGRQTPEILSRHVTRGSGALQNRWFPSPSAKSRITAQGGRPRHNIRCGAGAARHRLHSPSAPHSPRGRAEKEKQAAGPETSIEGQSRKFCWPGRVKFNNRLFYHAGGGPHAVPRPAGKLNHCAPAAARRLLHPALPLHLRMETL